MIRRLVLCGALPVALLTPSAGCQGTIEPGAGLGPAAGDRDPGPGAGGLPAAPADPGAAGRPGGAAGGGSPAGGATPASPAAAGPGACARDLPPARIWRLSADQYANTLAAAFGHRADPRAFPREAVDASTGFEVGPGGAVLGETLTRTVLEQAELVAARVVGGLTGPAACVTRRPVSDDCVKGFVAEVGRKAFRRPLAADETDRLLALWKTSAGSQDERGSAETVVNALLLSPSFLYRTELGAPGRGAVKLDPFELASALSYGIADGPPDAELFAAATEGRLDSPGELERQARRLARSPAAAEKLGRFMQAQLGVAALETAVADPTLGAALLAESKTFVREVLAGDRPSLETLYTAPFTFIDGTLASVYGLPNRPKQVERVALDPQQRFGVFTQPGFLRARHGAIFRGRMIRESFLCQDIPLPPEAAAAMQDSLPPVPKEATEADRWRAFQDALPACAACHQLFQPIGVAFDRYDDDGRHRLRNEQGRAIETAGEVPGAVGWSGRFSDARDLVQQILASPEGQACFARRLATYVFGRPPAATSCGVRRVSGRFAEAGLDLRELLVVLATDETFFTRAREE